MRVLLIEDNPPSAYLARFLLERRGHSVDVATTGTMGLAMARRRSYGAILLDLCLPDGDGCALAEQLCSPGAPVIAVSAHALAADRRRASDAGCRSFIEKPIDVASFVDHVEAVVAARR